MPMVGGKKFPYTEKGKADAKKAKEGSSSLKSAGLRFPTEDSMGRSAARATAVKKGATPGEANRARNVTQGEVRENKYNADMREKAASKAKGKKTYGAPFYGDGRRARPEADIMKKKQALKNYGKKK